MHFHTTTSTPTGVSAGAARNRASRHGVGRDDAPADTRLHMREGVFSEVDRQQLLVSSEEYARIGW